MKRFDKILSTSIREISRKSCHRFRNSRDCVSLWLQCTSVRKFSKRLKQLFFFTPSNVLRLNRTKGQWRTDSFRGWNNLFRCKLRYTLQLKGRNECELSSFFLGASIPRRTNSKSIQKVWLPPTSQVPLDEDTLHESTRDWTKCTL